MYGAVSLTLLGLAFGRFMQGSNTATGSANLGSVAVSPSANAVDPQAISTLEATVQRRPDDVRSLDQLALAYARNAAFGDPAFYDLANRALTNAERLAPKDDVTAIVRATLDLSLHQFARARAIGLAVHRRSQLLNDAEAVLVDASVELGQYDDAQRYLQDFVDRRASLQSYARVSYLRELRGDLDGAATSMQLAINAGQPGSGDVASVTSLLGDIEFNRGDRVAAERAYRAALRSSPQLPSAHIGLARVDASRGHLSAAIASLDELTQRVPLPSAVSLLGDLQRLSGDAKAAASSYALVDAISTVQRHAGQVVDFELAQFDLDHGRVTDGVRLAERAYQARPDNMFVADVLAWARYRQGRFDEARTLSNRALRIGSVDPAMHFHAAAIAFALGDTNNAKRELVVSQTRNPYFSFAVRNEVAALQRKLGR